jgi:hypothetical protein
MPKYEDLVDLR